MTTDLQQRIDFIKAIDSLKEVQRKTCLFSESRYENSAEHSWAVATFALTLADYAPEGSDINRVIHMLLLHDIVEVDAGDTLCYDEIGNADKAEREQTAADRLFGLLPTDTALHFRTLWDEFETEETLEAKFANALDRMIPVLHNLETGGRAWKENSVTFDQVISKNQKIAHSSQALWDYLYPRLTEAKQRGWLK
ncbi:HD domain-containing protein [Rubritalea sp.]|uniref:HD domain-containing protein n=1 Tax=Rubritalea sp. TaxID=2109375 RepID=UPI003EF9EA1C